MLKSTWKLFLLLVLTCVSRQDSSQEDKLFYCNKVWNVTDYSYTNASIRNNRSCLFDKTNSIRIELERLSRVSDIGINLGCSLTNGTAGDIDVTLTRNVATGENIKFYCPYSTSETHIAYYRCINSANDAKYIAAGILAGSIEISVKSDAAISINPVGCLNHAFSWISVIRKDHEGKSDYTERCSAPGRYYTQTFFMSLKFYKANDAVRYCCNDQRCERESNTTKQRICTGNSSWTDSPPRCLMPGLIDDWITNGCPPIDPYVGMPHEYAEDEASKNPNELNKKLREQPCRDGYLVVEYDVNNPRRCENNQSWTGAVPNCKLITCRTPPPIDHGVWRYAGHSIYHLAQYTCQNPFVLAAGGNGVAKCNMKLNKWEGVPSCVNLIDYTPLTGETNQDPTVTEETVAGTTVTKKMTSPSQIETIENPMLNEETKEEPSSLEQSINILMAIICALLLALIAAIAGALLTCRARMMRKAQRTQVSQCTPTRTAVASVERASLMDLHMNANQGVTAGEMSYEIFYDNGCNDEYGYVQPISRAVNGVQKQEHIYDEIPV